MATLTIKNIPDEVYDRLRHSAAGHRRSIKQEAIVCLEQQLQKPEIEIRAFLARVQRLRQKTSAHRLTDRELSKMKKTGRP